MAENDENDDAHRREVQIERYPHRVGTSRIADVIDKNRRQIRRQTSRAGG